ncbi:MULTISPECIES: NADH-quinone oxidoreductase subunit C [unclassified Methanoregula]|uniref:hydrogenase large subunit n=1 Tax=unclassified Methanoregula TaxID=2649730 RepID=UPI0009CAABC2|nr:MULTISPECIES: NADH-quinone oxidoreductase subunit C [unclassified Methanoregula]OPX62956.1 MAG: Membrane-bound hydrogenase subunit alpha [Methanoregula sp. PtaB.Bin085]OPY35169.1 MAG: Membrane-bound hydrogenase subunit alpha [Methanoregula sp. PtaU1.Bin006]
MTQTPYDGTCGIRELLGFTITDDRITRGPAHEYSVRVDEQEYVQAAENLALHDFALAALFACEEFSGRGRYSIFSVFERKQDILILVRDVDGHAVSIAGLFPSACWYERECRDGFGITFDGAFDTRRLLLHECYPDGYHPLKKEVPNRSPEIAGDWGPEREYPFRVVNGEGVYQVPVGPVHAGIIEPGHFRFSVIGETIFNLEVRMFYKHRGIEKLAEGRLPADCLPVAEAVSGDESVANATAFCMAVEQASQIAVPGRAWYLRTILLELERIVSHLSDQAGMLVDVAFPLGANQFSVLREEIVRTSARLTGSRFMRGRIRIGGVSEDISSDTLSGLVVFLTEFRKRYRVGLKIVLSTPSVIDRFATTGIVRKSLLRPLNITGPVARASGGNSDVRVNRPYGIYDQYTPRIQPLSDGDVLARFTVKASEIMDSLDLIERLVADIPGGETCSSDAVRDGHALAVIESPRGQNLCWVRIRDGRIDRYKVRTASFCNWLAIEHAVQGNILADFPVINKSMNLSYAGTDL